MVTDTFPLTDHVGRQTSRYTHHAIIVGDACGLNQLYAEEDIKVSSEVDKYPHQQGAEQHRF